MTVFDRGQIEFSAFLKKKGSQIKVEVLFFVLKLIFFFFVIVNFFEVIDFGDVDDSEGADDQG